MHRNRPNTTSSMGDSKLVSPFDLFGVGTQAQLEVHVVSRSVVFNGNFICVSVYQLVLVCPGCDMTLLTPSVGANDLCC